MTKKLINSEYWLNNSGGKSNTAFYTTNDNRFLIKAIREEEFDHFIENGQKYFEYQEKCIFGGNESCIVPVLAAFRVKRTENQVEKTISLFVMSNLFCGLTQNAVGFDLKGCNAGRYISKKAAEDKNLKVFQDSNLKEEFQGEPVPLSNQSYSLLKKAIRNDTEFLSELNIIDYSLLVIIDSSPSKTLRIGLIDYAMPYTFKRQMESFGKSMFSGAGGPAIVNPQRYKERLREAVDKYFLGI